MRYLFATLILCALAPSLALAADAPPSKASIEKLLAVTQARKLLEGSITNIDDSMEAAVKQSLQGKTISERDQKILAEMRGKMSAVVRESMSWEKMEPMLYDIYSRSLTQADVDGALAFYATDAGKAMIVKMPLVMQNTMQALQGMMSSLAPKLQKIQEETLAELKAEPAK